MASSTTFNWLYLGTTGVNLDPTEGNGTAENGSLLNGATFGSPTQPLYEQGSIVGTSINVGGSATALDTDNNVSNDQFSTDLGAGAGLQTFTFDALINYTATITYVDGTTANIAAARIAVSTTGEMFWVPDTILSASAIAMAARPIQSLTLNTYSSTAGFALAREVIGFDDGFITGTSGGDLIDGSYVEPLTEGSDRVDNNDAAV